MHILLIHQAFASLNEPGGTRHHEFARYLTTHGHHVTVIASPVSYLTGATMSTVSNEPRNRGEEKSGVLPSGGNPGCGELTILRASTYQALHKSFVHRMLAFFSFMVSSFWIGLGVKNVDVVWGTSPPIFQGLTAWLLARLKGAPLLFEVRDLWPQFAIAVGVLRNPILIRLSLWLEHFLYHQADRVMVNSPGYVTHVSKHGARFIELVPNGSDPQMFDPLNDGKFFRALNHLENKFVVLYAGAHGLSNDLGVVLEAAKILQNKIPSPEVMVTFLGDGKEKPALQAQAATLGLTNVLFLSSIPKTGMAEALAGADACLAILKPLDEYKTTYPNKVFDYMAAGRPVILAIDGVIRTVIEAAGGGIFTPPGNPSALADAIQKLAEDPGRSRKMGLAGRKYLEEHFSRVVMAARLLDVLETMSA
jgi:glycosyltransferase involved in cell wall biosynthesis